MDVEKKHKSESMNQHMEKLFKKIILIFLIIFYFSKVEQVKPVVPYYYLPSIKNLQKKVYLLAKCTNFYILVNIKKALI